MVAPVVAVVRVTESGGAYVPALGEKTGAATLALAAAAATSGGPEPGWGPAPAPAAPAREDPRASFRLDVPWCASDLAAPNPGGAADPWNHRRGGFLRL